MIGLIVFAANVFAVALSVGLGVEPGFDAALVVANSFCALMGLAMFIADGVK